MDLSLDFNNKHVTWQRLVNINLLIYTLLFISSNLTPGKYFDSEIHWLEAIVGAILWVLFLIKFFKIDSSSRREWLKTNSLVIVFLCLGVVNFVYNGFAYSIARTIFIESIYIVIITNFLCDSRFIKQVIFRLFVCINFIMNILPYIVNAILWIVGLDGGFANFIIKATYLDTKHALPYSLFYNNPNAMGIMTAISMIMAIMLFAYNYKMKNKGYKVLFVLYMIFSVYCLIVAECRSAIVSLAVAIIASIFIQIIGKKHGTLITVLALIGVVAICSLVLVFIHSNVNTGMNDLTDAEVKATTVSSDRYIIWKGTYLSQKDNSLLLGEGSLKFVEEGRDAYLENNYFKFFSYKDEDIEEQMENAGQLENGLNSVNSYLQSNNLTGTNKVKELINKEYHRQYCANLEKQEKEAAETPQEEKVPENRIKNIDTHNGYFSIFFCNGILGFIVFLLILLQRILQMKDRKVKLWYLPVMFILFLNIFESAFIADRFFPVVILFIVLSLDDRIGKEGKLHD